MSREHLYVGKFSEKQVSGNNYYGKKYGKNEHDSLNSYQTFLYNRALFGLDVYSEEEIKNMRWDKKQRVLKVHKRAQTVLNVWKQEIVNGLTTQLLMKLFPKSNITEFFLNTAQETDASYINKMTFKSLNIKKSQIISKLVSEKILPINFYELTNQELCK
jgi:hypothetical protein